MRVGGQLLAHAKRCALVTSFPSWQITVPEVQIRISEYILLTTVEFDAWNFGTRLNEGTTVHIQSNPIQILFWGFLVIVMVCHTPKP